MADKATVAIIDKIIPEQREKIPDPAALCVHIRQLLASTALILGVDSRGVTGFILQRSGAPVPKEVWIVCPWDGLPCDVEQPV